jgi:hypothetical protein
VAALGAVVVVMEAEVRLLVDIERVFDVSVDVFDKRTTPQGDAGATAHVSPAALLSGEAERERERALRSVPAEIWR